MKAVSDQDFPEQRRSFWEAGSKALFLGTWLNLSTAPSRDGMWFVLAKR